eukprot:ANDGO_02209.mRNA.1 hypothetical protein
MYFTELLAKWNGQIVDVWSSWIMRIESDGAGGGGVMWRSVRPLLQTVELDTSVHDSRLFCKLLARCFVMADNDDATDAKRSQEARDSAVLERLRYAVLVVRLKYKLVRNTGVPENAAFIMACTFPHDRRLLAEHKFLDLVPEPRSFIAHFLEMVCLCLLGIGKRSLALRETCRCLHGAIEERDWHLFHVYLKPFLSYANSLVLGTEDAHMVRVILNMSTCLRKRVAIMIHLASLGMNNVLCPGKWLEACEACDSVDANDALQYTEFELFPLFPYRPSLTWTWDPLVNIQIALGRAAQKASSAGTSAKGVRSTTGSVPWSVDIWEFEHDSRQRHAGTRLLSLAAGAGAGASAGGGGGGGGRDEPAISVIMVPELLETLEGARRRIELRDELLERRLEHVASCGRLAMVHARFIFEAGERKRDELLNTILGDSYPAVPMPFIPGNPYLESKVESRSKADQFWYHLYSFLRLDDSQLPSHIADRAAHGDDKTVFVRRYSSIDEFKSFFKYALLSEEDGGMLRGAKDRALQQLEQPHALHVPQSVVSELRLQLFAECLVLTLACCLWFTSVLRVTVSPAEVRSFMDFVSEQRRALDTLRVSRFSPAACARPRNQPVLPDNIRLEFKKQVLGEFAFLVDSSFQSRSRKAVENVVGLSKAARPASAFQDPKLRSLDQVVDERILELAKAHLDATVPQTTDSLRTEAHKWVSLLQSFVIQ